MDIPQDWRIEFNAKTTREKGDVAFHSPKNNIFFVSWGKLAEAQRRFKTLEEHRDQTINRIKKDPNLKSVEIVSSLKETMSGHDGIFSEVVAKKRSGLMSRSEPTYRLWSVHFYCPQTARYYVVYSQLKVEDEYPDFAGTFRGVTGTIRCHT
jgi:hypothetical protein